MYWIKTTQIRKKISKASYSYGKSKPTLASWGPARRLQQKHPITAPVGEPTSDGLHPSSDGLYLLLSIYCIWILRPFSMNVCLSFHVFPETFRTFSSPFFLPAFVWRAFPVSEAHVFVCMIPRNAQFWKELWEVSGLSSGIPMRKIWHRRHSHVPPVLLYRELLCQRSLCLPVHAGNVQT